MKKKYLKYFVFLMVSFLSTGFFIGRVKAAGKICTYHPTISKTVSFTAAVVPNASSKTFYQIKVTDSKGNENAAFCLKPGQSLSKNSELKVKDCSVGAIKNVSQQLINKGKQAINYCKSNSRCTKDTNSIEYAVAQVFAWNVGKSNSYQLVCQLTKGKYQNLKSDNACRRVANYDDEISGGLTSGDVVTLGMIADYETIIKEVDSIWEKVSKSSTIGAFTCLQDDDGTQQPIIATTNNFEVCIPETVPDKYYCYDENMQPIDITKCVNDYKNLSNAYDKCVEEEPACQEKFYCPPDSDKKGQDITKCVNNYKNLSNAYDKCVEEEQCYNTKVCKGLSYKYVGTTPLCKNDGNPNIASFYQDIAETETSDRNLQGSIKGYGEFHHQIGTYGALYCREISATIKFPSGLHSSIHLGGYLIWPTYDGYKASQEFGNLYPLSFQGTMQCYYQVAPDVSDLCNVNASEDYKTAYDNLLNAAGDGKGQLYVDKIGLPQTKTNEISYEGIPLSNYLGISYVNREKHTREDIRRFSQKSYTYKKCSTENVILTEQQSTTVEKNKMIPYSKDEPAYILKNSNAFNSSSWPAFVKNYDNLNTNLKNATVIADYSKIDLSKTGVYEYTLQYTTSTASPASYTTIKGYISVVDSVPSEPNTTISSVTKCLDTDITASIDNACLTETKSGCAENYFSKLEEWRSDNYTHFANTYNKNMNQCTSEFHNQTQTYSCTNNQNQPATCTRTVKVKNSTSYCLEKNKYHVKEYKTIRDYWKSGGTASDKIKNIKNNFNTYAGAYRSTVMTYLDIVRIAYDDTLLSCNGSNTCSVYNFMSGASVSYQDVGNGYKSYGTTLALQPATKLEYQCIANGGKCGAKPLVEMYPYLKDTNQDGDNVYIHNFDTWKMALFNKTFDEYIENVKPSVVSKYISDINTTDSVISTNEIYYKLNDADLYHYVLKDNQTQYYKNFESLPANKNYIPLGFGVLPTSYGNIPGIEYDLKLTDIVVGHEGAIGKTKLPTFDYVCKYKVTNDTTENLTCPPGTKNAGMILDLVQLKMSYEEAVATYCDGNPPDPECPEKCYYCTDANGAKIDITTCVVKNGGDIDTCERQWCKRYYCPEDTPNEGKEITNCVQRGNGYNTCVSTLCGKKGNKLFVYRTIDLNNPFPSMDADKTVKNAAYKDFFNIDVIGRKPGSNWFSGHLDEYTKENNYVKTEIIHNRDTTDDKAYEVYDKEPLYHFVLDRKTILAIRNYNKQQIKNGGYADFNLNCVKDESNKYVGMACVSSFLHNGTKYPELTNLTKTDSLCGKLSGTNNTAGLIKCLYEYKDPTGMTS